MIMKVELDLMPFRTPNCVLVRQHPGKKEDGFKEAMKLGLSELDSSILDKMCKDFRDEVFKKAGKEHPPKSER